KVFIPITITWIFVTAMLVYFGVIGGNAMGAAA
ncbi:MAG: hypothetical protein ACK4MZ_09915, partial [Thermomonas haemolytica]